jgi:hypothetical protein
MRSLLNTEVRREREVGEGMRIQNGAPCTIRPMSSRGAKEQKAAANTTRECIQFCPHDGFAAIGEGEAVGLGIDGWMVLDMWFGQYMSRCVLSHKNYIGKFSSICVFVNGI